MKELEAAVQSVLAGMAESGELQKVVETQVKKTVESVLSSCFNYNSPFQRALGEHINETLKIDFSGLGLAGYNDIVLKVIKAKLDSSVYQFATAGISKGMDELLCSPPKEIKLSELVKLLAKHAKEDSRDYAGVSCHVEWSDTSVGWGYVKLSDKPRQSARDCRFELAFSKDGEVYRIGLPYQGDVDKKVFAGPFFGFERALFQMYAAKTKLIVDEEHVDTCPDLD